jgi:hypothetical protein
MFSRICFLLSFFAVFCSLHILLIQTFSIRNHYNQRNQTNNITQTAKHLTALSSGSPVAHICYDTPDQLAEAQKAATLSGPGGGGHGIGGDEFGGGDFARATAFGTISANPKSATEKVDHTYLKVQKQMVQRSQQYGQKFVEHIVSYTKEWDDATTARITGLQKEQERRRLDLEHYTRKVEGMRMNVNKAMAMGKKIPSDAQEKLQRNEIKLSQSKDGFEKYTHDFFLIINEVTDRAWKDLYPLLVKILQFDMTLASDEMKLYGNLKATTKVLRDIGTAHDLDINGRFTAIRTLQADYLFTGDRSQLFQRTRMLENGGGGGGSQTQSAPNSANYGVGYGDGGGGPNNTNAAGNPGWANDSTGASGNGGSGGGAGWASQGGYEDSFSGGTGHDWSNNPQQQRSQSTNNLSSSSNNGHSNHHPDQLEMLGFAASSAPPPTMDDLTAATGDMDFGGGGAGGRRASTPTSAYDPFANNSQSLTVHAQQQPHQWGNPSPTQQQNSWQQQQPVPMAAPPPPPPSSSPMYSQPHFQQQPPPQQQQWGGGAPAPAPGLNPYAGPQPTNQGFGGQQQQPQPDMMNQGYPPQQQPQQQQQQQQQAYQRSTSNPFD